MFFLILGIAMITVGLGMILGMGARAGWLQVLVGVVSISIELRERRKLMQEQKSQKETERVEPAHKEEEDLEWATLQELKRRNLKYRELVTDEPTHPRPSEKAETQS